MTTRRLYDRRLRLEVASEVESGTISARSFTQDYHITFNVTGTAKGKRGKLSATIQNLTDDEIARFRARRAVVSLFGGYRGNVGRLFVGDVTRATEDRKSEDITLSIEGIDGYRKYREIILSRSFRKTTVFTALRRLAEDAGFPIEIDPRLTDQDLPGGYVATGLARDIFEPLANTIGADWFTWAGRLLIVPKDTALQRTGVLISPATGLVEDPTVTGRNTVRVVSLLQPELVPRRLFLLEDFSGATFTCRALTVQHSGDSGWADPFYTTIEARKL